MIEWVPVGERLPLDMGTYLTWTEDGCIEIDNVFLGPEGRLEYRPFAEDITHWAPINPPAEKESE